MSSKQTPTQKSNKLTVPLIISLCVNLILVVAVVILAVSLTQNVQKQVQAALESQTTETTPAETTPAQTYSFQTASGETVELYDMENAYIVGDFTCVGDESKWSFQVDEETNDVTLKVTSADGAENMDYTVNLYQTVDGEQLLAQVKVADSDTESLWYVSNILEEEGSENVVGIYMTEAAEGSVGVVLYLDDFYAEHAEEIKENMDTQSDTAADLAEEATQESQPTESQSTQG